MKEHEQLGFRGISLASDWTDWTILDGPTWLVMVAGLIGMFVNMDKLQIGMISLIFSFGGFGGFLFPLGCSRMIRSCHGFQGVVL